MSDQWAAASDALRGEKYINLETFKRDGSGVKTPVWFAHEGEGAGAALVFMTDGRSWKVKRLRRNERARVAACDMRGGVRGEWFEASCHRIESPEEIEAAVRVLADKYGLVWRMTGLLSRVGRRLKHRAYYRIEAPDGPEAA